MRELTAAEEKEGKEAQRRPGTKVSGIRCVSDLARGYAVSRLRAYPDNGDWLVYSRDCPRYPDRLLVKPWLKGSEPEEETMMNKSRRHYLILPLCFVWCVAAGSETRAQTVIRASLAQPATSDREAQRIMSELNDVGSRLMAAQQQKDIVLLSLRQADLLARLSNRSKAAEQPALLLQMAESLHTAADCSAKNDHTAYQRLLELEAVAEATRPHSDLAASITLLEMQADYSAALAGSGKDTTAATRQRCERLTQFVANYPNAKETPDALLELAKLHKEAGRKEAARASYLLFAKLFPQDVQAIKVKREARWLELAGRTEFLVLPLLFTDDERLGEQFDVGEQRGKVVVVYFWESANPQCAGDFAALGALRDRLSSSELEIVCVCLDKDATAARAFLRGLPQVGVHLIARSDPKGLGDPIVERFGLASLPRTLVLGKDGMIAGQDVELSGVEAQVTEQLRQPAIVDGSVKEIGRRFPWKR
jgi:hypothetical protein